mmetsp:Transcript_124675/g.186243  ORF Transcript_124675/g.186243 Transcript_124675/m.186243 type:complete len:472 (-) Transcript_124675:34-1449(-)|eukprot:CAMPEP_0117030952 /NCGR_PEP_ID=MMETSP0472-20121206/22302_1 /TAXON_ID=693140 ORGANISM="Tiarina fusus, Strain LIS" /NCGR_SAMPLE_ID=MMETSP0472 /ASSEMBLY_ACC=CAM_ASM_000603 /LENGTH=471 /DNA_ID=CAMNT_0004739175 /DNA_START=30 /DNA_END=1445 /DNA_ORIENTATION=+
MSQANPNQKKGGKGKKKKGRKSIVLKTPKGTRDYDPLQMAIREKVINIITTTYKKYGAVTIETPLFELKETLTNKYGEDSKLIYDLEDQGGELCSLRYDLTVPFARHLAQNRIQSMKRYHIGRVYRRDQPSATQGRWREFYQCDFDIAGKNYEPLLPDAEALTAMVEVLKNINMGDFKVKINSRKLLDGIFALCDVPDEMFRTICSSVDKLDKMSWGDVKKEMLTKGLEEEKADKIWEFAQLNGKPKELLEVILSRGDCEANPSAKEGLSDLKILFDYLEIFEVLDNFSFDLSLARGLDYYTGIIFEAVMIDNSGLSVGSIAGGGRYDGLVEQFGGENVPCIGFSIGIERIFAILEAKEQEETRPCATEVMVFSNGNSKTDDLMRERMRILTMFRKAGIPAEMVYKRNPRTDFQMKYVNSCSIPFLVLLSPEDMENGTVSVKHQATSSESRNIPVADVVDFVRNFVPPTQE